MFVKHFACLLGLWVAIAGILSAAEANKPNIILIMADDLGYGDLSCYGNKRIRTRQLDRLAAEGIRFTDFHSSGAVCSPTRAGLVTGRYQQRANIPTVIFADPKRPTHPHGIQDLEVTFAELLTKAGYETAIFGKWHLGYYKKYNPVRHGFGQFRGYVSGNVDFFSHVDQAGRLDWWHNTAIQDEPGYTTHLITEYSVDFIKANHDKPFCLYVPYEPPHYPYQGPNDEPIRMVGKGKGAAEAQQSPAEIQQAYKEMVEEMDQGIGKIVATLKEHQIDRNTLVMFFSDNGANRRGNNGSLKGYKGQLWEGGHRVPGIAWWPGTISPAQVSEELVITLDVMPTVLDAAGLKLPQDRKLDGLSLLPLLTKGKSLGERTLFWGHGNARAMRQGPWKLVLSGGRQSKPALFNLAEDLSEQNNLAKQHGDRVEKMSAAIEGWEEDVAADATQQPDTPPKEE